VKHLCAVWMSAMGLHLRRILLFATCNRLVLRPIQSLMEWVPCGSILQKSNWPERGFGYSAPFSAKMQ
jgi:hypothetical protein